MAVVGTINVERIEKLSCQKILFVRNHANELNICFILDSVAVNLWSPPSVSRRNICHKHIHKNLFYLIKPCIQAREELTS